MQPAPPTNRTNIHWPGPTTNVRIPRTVVAPVQCSVWLSSTRAGRCAFWEQARGSCPIPTTLVAVHLIQAGGLRLRQSLIANDFLDGEREGRVVHPFVEADHRPHLFAFFVRSTHDSLCSITKRTLCGVRRKRRFRRGRDRTPYKVRLN